MAFGTPSNSPSVGPVPLCHQLYHRIKNLNAHRQYIKNLTLSGGWFKEEKPCGSKCSRNGTLSYVNVVKDMYCNIIPEHLPIQI